LYFDVQDLYFDVLKFVLLGVRSLGIGYASHL